MKKPLRAMDDIKPLAPRNLRFSKRMVALSLLFLVAAFFLVMSSWHFALIVGLVSGGIGFVIFFTAGCYWGCDNESCS